VVERARDSSRARQRRVLRDDQRDAARGHMPHSAIHTFVRA
jgi:hypothetical protein